MHEDAEDEPVLTKQEREVIASLKRLAKRWPKTLTLAIMGGDLVVVRTGYPRLLAADSSDAFDAILDDIEGIPNTGGDW